MTDIQTSDLMSHLSKQAIASKIIPGMQPFFKYGAIFAPTASTTSTIFPSDVLVASAQYPWLTAAKELFAVSTSVEDADGLTGARALYVEGMGADGSMKTATILLDGTTPVSLGAGWIRTDRAYIGEVGSVGTNLGTIKIYHTAVAAGNIVNGITAKSGGILSAAGQSLNTFYTVRKGEVVYIDKLGFSAISSQSGEILLRFRAPKVVDGVRDPLLREGWRTQFYKSAAVANTEGIDPDQGICFGEFTDIEVMGIFGTNGKCSAWIGGSKWNDALVQDLISRSLGPVTA